MTDNKKAYIFKKWVHVSDQEKPQRNTLTQLLHPDKI
jgi:hypothetical protein